MRFCKRETFLYWCVHCFIWIIMTIPTVIFFVRTKHLHDVDETNSKINVTHEKAETTNPGYCANYTMQRCQLNNNMNTTMENNDRQMYYDKEIGQVLRRAYFRRNNSVCNKLLREVLYLQKYVWCGSMQNPPTRETSCYGQHQRLFNNTKKFCENCSKIVRVQTNVSRESGAQYKWLKNRSCLSFHKIVMVELIKNKISERNACTYPMVEDENATCRISCDWSLISSTVRDVYYVVMVLNEWAALVATIITTITLVSFKQMRTFPHIVRVYILIFSVLYATVSLLPLRIGLAKFYCEADKFWHQDGHTSKHAIIEGALSHYLFLGFSFWSLCYVANTYSVIVKHTQHIFVHKTKYHAIQFAICSILPAMLVGINMLGKWPGYKSMFLDRITMEFTLPILGYMTFTLPVQISLGVAATLLWSVIHFVRKVRKNRATSEAIRPGQDITAFADAEKQFTKLAVLYVITVVVVLSSNLTISYKNNGYIHEVEQYFECLKVLGNCSKPDVQIFFLSSVKISCPGIYCLLNFFLLIFNKDMRNVWKRWLNLVYATLTCRENKNTSTYSTNHSEVESRMHENKAKNIRYLSTVTNASSDCPSKTKIQGVSTPDSALANTKVIMTTF